MTKNESSTISIETLREFIRLQKIDDKEYLYEQFPNISHGKLGRAFNQVHKLNDTSPKKALKEKGKKKKGKLQRFQAKILKAMEEKNIVSFTKLRTFVEVNEGVLLANGEVEAIMNSINKLPTFEIVDDIIKKVKPKKESLEVESLRKEIKEINENILDLKRIVRVIYKPFSQHFQEIKKMIVENHKETIGKVIANSNKFEDLRGLIKQEHDLIQGQIQDYLTLGYQQLNPGIKVKQKRSPP